MRHVKACRFTSGCIRLGGDSELFRPHEGDRTFECLFVSASRRCATSSRTREAPNILVVVASRHIERETEPRRHGPSCQPGGGPNAARSRDVIAFVPFAPTHCIGARRRIAPMAQHGTESRYFKFDTRKRSGGNSGVRTLPIHGLAECCDSALGLNHVLSAAAVEPGTPLAGLTGLRCVAAPRSFREQLKRCRNELHDGARDFRLAYEPRRA
jgi:hypothetical protein